MSRFFRVCDCYEYKIRLVWWLRMNLIDLEAFVAVVDHGSVVAASAVLHLTQSAVTRRIQNLEDAVAYLEAAPDNFGGHKAAAIQASRAAIGELRASLAFRAQQDRR